MNAEMLLIQLPTILAIWTSITLCWGVLTEIIFASMMHWQHGALGRIRKSDTPRLILLSIVNVFLALYLWSNLVFSFVGDTILVFDVFYTAILVETSLDVVRWYEFKRKYLQRQVAVAVKA